MSKMLCALLKNEYLFFKYFFNDLRYGKKFKQIKVLRMNSLSTVKIA